ncbi:pentatricopeptide repeat-containing protein At1g69290 [Pyrus x bretschneideri]|uniref:pentatricopeptide repeat-containing protein At1g69290 n=1 Tax=Pyrus x bretschneideri TaxID=225117 RepID=UPI00202E1F20|nr:pentatricopeptide repeat-containing protein At1g69290 [Pyrus x bretschneideri]
MWRKLEALTHVLPHRRGRAFSSTPEIPTLYSFLQPSIFSLKRDPPPSSSLQSHGDLPTPPPKTLSPDHIAALETALHKSLITHDTDEAWKSFKTFTGTSAFPSKSLTNSLITHLSSLGDVHNLKRAFATTVYVVEKNPGFLEFKTVGVVLDAMKCANTAAPAFALVKCMFKNRFFLPFSVWGSVLVEISRKNGNFVAFLRVFEENCRIALDEKLEFMKPGLAACNAALEGCCRELESVSDAEKVVETMAVLGVRPDESSFGFLAYLYALKGLEEKITELEGLMGGFGFSDKRMFRSSLIKGYVKSGKLESVSASILRCLSEGDGECLNLGEETYCEVVKGYLANTGVKELATLIIEAQKLESSRVDVDRSVGYGIVNACVSIGLSDKAHSILDEMNAQGGSLGLGVYVPILKAYCKEHRTAEATQLVMDISNLGLELDMGTYDALIEASMSSQDFQSAFSLFRDMREARISDLKGSYLTIMTGLMENHRPELMAAFLDEVVEDPRVEVGTHDWNSIIHAFCKAGRLEDARRTFRRMIFLQHKPNEQTYLSLISGYVSMEKYFSVLMLWHEVKRNVSVDGEKGIKFDHHMVDAFLYALVKGGFFDAVMQVVEKSQEMKVFVDKWRYKQAFMETHKKLKVAKLRKRNFKKMEALVAFKNWAGLNA